MYNPCVFILGYIGGPEVAAAMLGWENVFHCEINPFGRRVLEYWFPNSDSYEDIKTTDFTKYQGQIDVLTGGFPCQPFSYAGQRKGANDDRYLWPEFKRVIAEVRPAWVVGENVAGIISMVEPGKTIPLASQTALFDEGDGVRRYRYEQPFTIERVCLDLEGLGYAVQPIVIPACAVGAPHKRDRVFIIAQDTLCLGLHGTEVVGHQPRPWDIGTTSNDGKVGDAPNPNEPRPEGMRRERENEIRGFEPTSDPNSHRGGEIHQHMESQLTDGAKPVSDGGQRHAANTERLRLQHDMERGSEERVFGKADKGRENGLSEQIQCPETISQGESVTNTESEGGGSLRDESGAQGPRNGDDLLGIRCGLSYQVGERWANFPSVSPVHAGNDGIPFRMDRAAVSFAKWRNESLKAYGNAIVPQVMYEIFRAIQIVSEQCSEK